MIELTQYRSQFEKIEIIVKVYLKQDGFIIDIIAPNEHLGGLGVGVPYTRTNGSQSANFHCLSFPGHRDAELAGILAQKIAKITKMKTIVILVLNIPNITKSQIDDLSQFFIKWFTRIGEELLNFSSLNSHKKVQQR
jgi:hypothetical protein